MLLSTPHLCTTTITAGPGQKELLETTADNNHTIEQTKVSKESTKSTCRLDSVELQNNIVIVG